MNLKKSIATGFAAAALAAVVAVADVDYTGAGWWDHGVEADGGPASSESTLLANVPGGTVPRDPGGGDHAEPPRP